MSLRPRVATRALAPVLAAVLVAGMSAAPAHAAPTLEGPVSAIGDPARTVTLVLRGAKTGKLVLRASAGRLSEPRPRGADWVIELTPPRVALPTEVVIRGAGAPYRLRVDPMPRADPPPASDGPIRLEGPGALVLGKDRTADLRIRTPDGTKPGVRTSRGSISDPAPGPDGVWRATYTAPKERTPALAIIAAWTDDGAAWGWLRIPLIAVADIDVETEPDAVVVLRSGNEEFGPFQMGKSGRGSFPVIVPPAVRYVRTEVVGAGGARGARQSVDLRPPSFERVVAGYAGAGERIFAFAIDPAAAPARVESIEPPASGRIGAAEPLGPGVTAWKYQPAADAKIGERVPVKILGGEAGNVVLDVVVQGRPPSGLRLALEPPVWTSGSGETVAVVISWERTGSAPVIEVPVELEVDHGEISPARRQEDGRLVARWVPGDRIPERRVAVRARSGALASIGHLELRPGPASRLDVRSEAERLRADGISNTRILIEASDAAGNPLPAERLVASAGGSLGALAAEGRPGAWVATYTAPRRERAVTDVVEIRADGIQARAPIALWPTRPRLLTGAAVGFVTNFGRVAAPAATVQATVPLPFGGDRWYGGLESGFYASRSRITTSTPGEPVEVAVRVLPVLAVCQYRLPAGPADLVGSATAGVFVAETAISSPSAGTRSAVEPYPALGAAAGAEYPFGIGRAFVETGYWHARAGGRVRGSLGGLRVTSGYRLQF